MLDHGSLLYSKILKKHRVAGSDTTSIAIQSTLLAIILNPRVYKKMESEFKAAVVAKRVT